jgi:hypothetical protein
MSDVCRIDEHRGQRDNEERRGMGEASERKVESRGEVLNS